MTTDFVMKALIGAALIWEFWTLINKKPHDTISETVWRLVSKRPIIPFLAGLLAGHLFWQSSRCTEILGGL